MLIIPWLPGFLRNLQEIVDTEVFFDHLDIFDALFLNGSRKLKDVLPVPVVEDPVIDILHDKLKIPWIIIAIFASVLVLVTLVSTRCDKKYFRKEIQSIVNSSKFRLSLTLIVDALAIYLYFNKCLDYLILKAFLVICIFYVTFVMYVFFEQYNKRDMGGINKSTRQIMRKLSEVGKIWVCKHCGREYLSKQPHRRHEGVCGSIVNRTKRLFKKVIKFFKK